MRKSKNHPRGFVDGLRPEPNYSVWEWADKYRVLTSEASSETGLYRTSRTPYWRQVMEDLSARSPVQEVIVMKSAQVGATEVGMNWLGYIMDVAPGPVLLMMPTDETGKDTVLDRLDPMIKNCPRLAAKVPKAKSRDGQNTMRRKDFPGGKLTVIGANAPAPMRSKPIRFEMFDEVDAFPASAGKEGDPITLAKKRTATFSSSRKMFEISTPLHAGVSKIEWDYLRTDQRKYFCPCPYCGERQTLEWDNIKWDPGRPESAMLFCIECGIGIEERYKTIMLRDGEWRATCPENAHPLKAGYFINALYSPVGWFSWAKCVEQYEEAELKDDDLLRQVHVNTVLGLPYNSSGQQVDWQDLKDRAFGDRNKPSNEVYLITVGVDVQRDRLECEIVGWGKGRRSWSIDYRVLYGDTSNLNDECWQRLEMLADETWIREDEVELPMRRMCLDSGDGSMTNTVYLFCHRFFADRVVPIKGRPIDVRIANPKPVDVSRSGKKIGTTKVWGVGVDILKGEFYGFLNLQRDPDGEGTPPGWCEFPEYGQTYFQGITAEVNVREYDKHGRSRWVWKVKQGVRNEPLDCRIYARAAASMLGIDRMTHQDFDRMAEKWQRVKPATKPSTRKAAVKSEPARKKKKKKKSSFWN